MSPLLNETSIMQDSQSLRSHTRSLEEDALEQLLKEHTKSIAWKSAGPAASDFRSMVSSTIVSMISIVNTTLRDDVFQEDTTTTEFECDIAARCDQSAGLFTITGTMANQLGLRTLLTQPPHAILADSRAHILTNEAGGPAFMSGAMIQAVEPSNGKYLRLEDIEANAVLTNNIHKCPTRVIALENTISGVIVPLSEMVKISRWARKKDIKIHLDGARLFEAVAAGAGSLQEYCRLVDTVTVDFSKDLGAPMGAMLLGGSEHIAQARWIRKSIGGGMRQAGVLSAAARVAVEEQFGSGDCGQAGKLRRVHENAKKVGEMWQSRGGKITKEIETNQVWIDLQALGIEDEEWNEIGRSQGVCLDGPRLVFHHQIGEEAIQQLGRAFDIVISRVAERKENS
ncbi:putative alanine racemase [Macroventuria anomochaeta]|uniref:Alanine racemase n=1 Tax=Macroventuria anomochaeta TaxID=301207 RepID=A0ACB6S3T4_9PLEO|nr:putative alanine racemase [Macroventuria anomochaeta]KAF2628315.1 putative alanine racemase [Macroventuria anomochaeta]